MPASVRLLVSSAVKLEYSLTAIFSFDCRRARVPTGCCTARRGSPLRPRSRAAGAPVACCGPGAAGGRSLRSIAPRDRLASVSVAASGRLLLDRPLAVVDRPLAAHPDPEPRPPLTRPDRHHEPKVEGSKLGRLLRLGEWVGSETGAERGFRFVEGVGSLLTRTQAMLLSCGFLVPNGLKYN